MYYKSTSYRIFNVFNYIILSIIALLCVLPMIHILAVSFSGRWAANANIIGLIPIDFTIDSYVKTIDNPNFIRSLGIAILRTVLGTAIGMLVILCAGYALSKEYSYFKSRNIYIWIFVITMMFSGGLVPSYILITNLGLTNTIWSLVLPGAVGVFNLILIMNFFRAIPKELEEAALLDGAGVFRTMFEIYLPISMPAIATVSLFTMVGHWNSWFDGLIYLTDSNKYPLATYLQTIVVQQDFSKMSLDPRDLENMSQRTVKAAQIFIGAIPILLVYPFLQKYFVKGIVLGAVKE